MAYYPNNYYYQNPYMQGGQIPAQNNQIPQQPVQPQQQIRSDNFVHVNSEEEARNFPVGVGNAVQFKDDNRPFLYVKSMGFNQFEPPHFERYRLVKEEEPEPQAEEERKNDVNYFDIFTTIDDFNNLKNVVAKLEGEIRDLKSNHDVIVAENKKTPSRVKKDIKESDSE